MPRRRLALAALVSTLAALAAPAFTSCTTTEGERCNPSLSHDECASNLTCTTPTNCGYAVCCPTEAPERAAGCAPCATDGGDLDAAFEADGGPLDANPTVDAASDASPADAGSDVSSADASPADAAEDG